MVPLSFMLSLLSGVAPTAGVAQDAAAVPDARPGTESGASWSWRIGAPLPEIVLPTVERDRTVAVAELRGRPVIVLVVAPGSEASRQALADAARRARDFAAEGASAAGAPELVAVIRELHPDRAQLLAAWLGVTFPLLWDPFVTVAPELQYTTALVDARGIVRALDVPLGDAGALRELVARSGAGAAGGGQDGGQESAAGVAIAAYVAPALAAAGTQHAPGSEDAVRAALSRVLWQQGSSSPQGAPEASGAGARDTQGAQNAPTALGETSAALEAARAAVEQRAARAGAAPLDHLRAGQVRWLRHSSRCAVPGDATAAVQHWTRAAAGASPPELFCEPMRRLGPRLAKREAPYAWALRARYELEERAEVVRDLAPPLLEAEVLAPSTELPRLSETEPPPDPEREVPRDEAELVRVEGVAVPNFELFAPGADTTVATARVLLVVSPGEGAQFDQDAPAPRAWLVVPQGFGIDRNLYALALDADDPGHGSISLDVELVAPAGVARGSLRGYVLAHVFDRQGRRAHVRRELNVPVPVRPGQ